MDHGFVSRTKKKTPSWQNTPSKPNQPLNESTDIAQNLLQKRDYRNNRRNCTDDVTTTHRR